MISNGIINHFQLSPVDLKLPATLIRFSRNNYVPYVSNLGANITCSHLWYSGVTYCDQYTTYVRQVRFYYVDIESAGCQDIFHKGARSS